MGFPYDQGGKNFDLRGGSYLGPDYFRKILNNDFGVLKNVELGINIEDHLPNISDYGNIQTGKIVNGQYTMGDGDLKALHEKLKVKLSLCLERNNTAFIIGGTKDMVNPICQAYIEFSANIKNILVMMTHRQEGLT